jgi:hypothetical protein
MIDAAKMASIPTPKAKKSGFVTTIPYLSLVTRPNFTQQNDTPTIFHSML